MWNFQGSLFLALEFPRDLANTILWNIKGLSFVLPGISGVKLKNEKFQGVKKVYPQPHPVWIFPGIAHLFAICLLFAK